MGDDARSKKSVTKISCTLMEKGRESLSTVIINTEISTWLCKKKFYSLPLSFRVWNREKQVIYGQYSQDSHHLIPVRTISNKFKVRSNKNREWRQLCISITVFKYIPPNWAPPDEAIIPEIWCTEYCAILQIFLPDNPVNITRVLGCLCFLSFFPDDLKLLKQVLVYYLSKMAYSQ